MSSFRWGKIACPTPTNSPVTVCELRQLLFSPLSTSVDFVCFAPCFCLSPLGWEKVLSLEMMWASLGALSFDVNGLYESQTTFPFLWGSNLNQNKLIDPFLDSSPIQNQASLVFGGWNALSCYYYILCICIPLERPDHLINHSWRGRGEGEGVGEGAC